MTPGKIRGLTACSTDDGIFSILAIDHRDSLRAVLEPEDPAGVPGEQLTRLKLELLEGLGSRASAVMLDPEYGAAQAIATRTLPGSVGFLVALEEQGYLGDPTARKTSILRGWSVEKAKRLGANGIKLLVLYRPEAGEVTELQEALISSVVHDCETHDIPLFLEPLAYSLETSSEDFAAKRRPIVIETVRRLTTLGPDVLKIQFPLDAGLEPDKEAWADACAELNEAATVPWALLSGGDPYQVFRNQVHIACQAGSSGFMVGRALWSEYATSPAEERESLLESSILPRFDELAGIATDHGRDWMSRSKTPEIGPAWYLGY